MTESKRPSAAAKKSSAPTRAGAKREPAKKTASKPAAKKSAPNKASTPQPQRAKTSTPMPPCIFMPTLLPDPFGETSPELCWELRVKAIRVAIRLTQFGWNARVFGEGLDPVTEKADHLSDLRELLSAHALPKAVAASLSGPWVLAYDTAGF